MEDYDILSLSQWELLQHMEGEIPENWEANYNKKRMKSEVYVAKYGLSLQQIRQIWLDQNYKCAICGNEVPDPGKVNSERETHVDHCHKTDRVRGVLCNNCNRGLGCFNDNPTVLTQAANYLLNYRHRYHDVPKEEPPPVRSKVRMVCYKDKKQSIGKWAKELQIPYQVLYWRLNKAYWSIEMALTIPYHPRSRIK